MITKPLGSLFLLLFFLGLAVVQAQTVEVVEVDRDKGITNTNFPFDQEFFIKMVYDTKPRINYLEVFEGKKNYKSFPVTKLVPGQPDTEQRFVFKDSTILAVITKVKIVEVEKKFEVLVPMPRLRPDKDYNLVVHDFISDKETNDYIRDAFVAHQHNSVRYVAFSLNNLARQSVIGTSQTQQVTNLTYSSKKSKNQALAILSSYGINPTYKLSIEFDYLRKIGNTYVAAKIPLADYHAVLFSSIFSQLQQTLVQTAIDDLLAQIKADAMKTDTQSVVPTTLQVVLTTLQHTATVIPGDFDYYTTGRKSLTDFPHIAPETALPTNPSVPLDLPAKLEVNLNSSIKALAQLRLYSQATHVTDPNQKELIKFCSDLIAKMQERQDALIKLTAIYNKLINEMQTDQRLVSDDSLIIGSSSRVFGIDTRSKVQILPDFGLAYYSAVSNPLDSKQIVYNHRNFNGFAPFLGINISIAPINKDIPLRALRGMPGKTLRQFSFFAGVTLNSIAKDNERKDLFGSKSLLAGIGFRLSNAIRLSTGALMFNAKSPNSVINQYHFSAVPYVALSLDISLRAVLKDVTGLISPLLN